MAKELPTIVYLKDFCLAYGISAKTVRRLIGSGKIGHIRINNRIAFSPEHIESYLKSREVPASNQPKTTVDEVLKEAKAKLLKKRNA